MPRRPKTNKKLTKIDEIVMKTAVLKVIDGWSIRSAAQEAGICHQTLKRYVVKYRNTDPKDHHTLCYAPKYEINKVFSDELELLLKEYLIKACKLHHGLTRNNVKQFAYQIAVKNNLKIPASWREKQMTGEDWLKGFRKRHSSLSIRKPEGTSLSRATAFNPTNVNEFFDNLASVYSRFDDLQATDIYNLDETALTTVHNPPKVLGPKGQKQVGQVTSGERGVLVTACCFINAGGQAVPPFLIFPRVNFKAHMLNGAPNGCEGSANKSGWVNGEIFVQILKHFVKCVKCTKEKPIILTMDNHESHITIDSLEFSKQNGIILVTLPPHTSGKLQPLDKTVYKSLKTNYNVACNEWMISNPGRPINIYDIAGLFGRAYLKSFTPENIINGFKYTGIWPINRDIFTPDDYLSSYVSDRPADEVTTNLANNNDPDNIDVTVPEPPSSKSPMAGPSIPESPVTRPSTPETPEARPLSPRTPVAGPSKPRLLLIKGRQIVVAPQPTTPNILITPEQIKPYPKALPRKTTVARKRKGKSKILTDTPIKTQIVEELQLRQTKKDSKQSVIKKRRVHIVKKKVFSDSSSSSSEDSPVLDDTTDDNQSDVSSEVDNNDILVAKGDFVIVQEGMVKGKIIYSIGEVISEQEKEVDILYLKHIPNFKFIRTQAIYTFKKSQIYRKLPIPEPSGATERSADLIIFKTNLNLFVKGMRCLK